MENREKGQKSAYNQSYSQTSYLQSEILMLEERLKTLEILKQTYERNSKEKSLEIDFLTKENGDLKSQLIEKNIIIEELQIESGTHSGLLLIIEELKKNKTLLEQDLHSKSSRIFELEHLLREQYEKNVFLLEENQKIQSNIKDQEKFHSNHIEELKSKIHQLTLTQRYAENRINKILKSTSKKRSPKKSNRKEIPDKSLKNLINSTFKANPSIEERLLKSEKKIREIESALSSTKNEFSSPSLRCSIKLRSSSQCMNNKKPRFT